MSTIQLANITTTTRTTDHMFQYPGVYGREIQNTTHRNEEAKFIGQI